jgi:hypothetical protein
MVRNRRGLAPWSLAREAGIQSATVDGTIEVPQYVQPTLSTGFVDEKGDWKGAKSSDRQFISIEIQAGIANTGTILAPTATTAPWPIDMTGYKDIFLAIKPSNGGDYAITAVMGPDSVSFANLSPVNAAANLKGLVPTMGSTRLDNLFSDPADSLTADVWNIFIIQSVLQNQKLLQFKIVNSSGGESDIETAFMRIV